MIEIRGLEPGGDVIEIGESARYPGDALAAPGQRLDALHRRPEQLLDAGEVDAARRLPELQNPVLGRVEQLGGRGPPLKRLAHDPRGDLDEPPQERLFAHDAGVILDVGGGGDGVDEERDIVTTTGRLELSAPRQLFRQRQGIDHVPSLGERQHGPEDPPVVLPVEHGVVDNLGRPHHGVGVDHHRR